MVTQDDRSQNPPRPRRVQNLPRDDDTNQTSHPSKSTPIFQRTAKVVAYIFHSNCQIFSVALGCTIVWFLSWMTTSRLIFFTRPLCSLPIISPMIPSCHTGAGRPIHWANYPELVDLQARTVGQLLDESVENSGLVLEMKKTEMASNDLIILVRASDLRSKDQIIERLSRFLEEARGAGRSLHSLGAKIQGAVDSIAILNNHALQTIEVAKAPPSLVASVLLSFSGRNPTEEALAEMFNMLMDDTSDHIARLREEAETSEGYLLRLQENLMVLREVTDRSTNELVEDFFHWVRTGVGADVIGKWDFNTDLLKNMENYQRKALAHVTVTLETLYTLDADMEVLRKRVAAPDIVGDKIPIEVHIKNIKAGVDRLKEGQVKANLRYGENVAKLLDTST